MEAKLVRGILVGSLLCSAVLVLVLISVRTRFGLVLVGLLLVTVAGYYSVPHLWRRGLSVDWFLSIAFLNLLVVVPELALRVTDFRYESAIEFGWPRPTDYIQYQPDELLFWRINPSYQGVNSLGFPGEEITVPKPDDVFRILFLGDSVTQQGYPQIVERFLSMECSENQMRFESTVLAVSGYSSYQGLVLAETYGPLFEPDLVAVFFGWNDHWQAYGSVDAEKTVSESNTALSKFADLAYHNLRVLQALNWLWVSLTGAADAPIGEVRVPLADYRHNLREIAGVFGEQGIPVIVITAPTSHYKLGVPDYLIEMEFAGDEDTVVALHKAYNQAVRDVGATGVFRVLDLEGEFSSMSEEALEDLFTSDGIHLTQTGMAAVGKRVFETVKTNDLCHEATHLDPGQ